MSSCQAAMQRSARGLESSIRAAQLVHVVLVQPSQVRAPTARDSCSRNAAVPSLQPSSTTINSMVAAEATPANRPRGAARPRLLNVGITTLRTGRWPAVQSQRA